MGSRGLSAEPPPAAAARHFRTADVARILALSAVRVRALARAGLCRPARRGRALEFSFQDLVLLRTAHGLLQQAVPPRRVRQALRELARQLPADRPLSGVRVYADGRRVVVRDGRAAWRADSGQAVFSFAVAELARASGRIVPVTERHRRAGRTRPERAETAADWFERGLALERDDAAAACAAYRQALRLDPAMGDAYVNLGRLLHEAGEVSEAVRLYGEAGKRLPDDPVVPYNLALALEDAGDVGAAAGQYQRALALDADFADAHFNLGRLLERLGRRAQALRHLLAYRKLTDRP